MANVFDKFVKHEATKVSKANREKYSDLFLDENELKKYKIKKTISTILTYTFLVLVALFILIPFYWMIATALRSDDELIGKVTFFPKALEFANFKKAFYVSEVKFAFFKEPIPAFLVFFINTIIVAFLTTIGTMVTTVLASFAFARLNFKGKDLIFSLLLATMMIPGEVFVITNYTTITKFGTDPFLRQFFFWAGRNTYGALILPFVTSVFYIFFLRQTFMQIPNELYLAAKVDGTGDFKYLWKIMIPIAKATLTTIFILSMMGTWNAYVWPSLVANKEHLRLVSNGLLQAFKSDVGQVTYNLQMAGTTLVSLPLLIVFIFLKKYIMRGVSRSGIKG